MIMKAAYDLLGSDGLIASGHGGNYEQDNRPSSVLQNYLFSLGPAIAGGASNIQRNIIGERGFGLTARPQAERLVHRARDEDLRRERVALI